VLDRVCVVWVGCFIKLLAMVLRLPHLQLEITFGGCDILLAGVICFLVATTVARRYDDVPGPPLLPLLATLCALPSALNGVLGWCGSAATGSRFHIA
jgi:hypothetical protein